VICSAHGVTSILFIPDVKNPVSSPSGHEFMELSSAPDASWIQRDRADGWALLMTIDLAKAAGINRTRDGARLDRAEKAQPVHDGLRVADIIDGSGYTIYWTGRRWIQVSSYD
jgi:hypothetical protein